MQNLLLEKPDYKIEETSLGTWKRFLYPSGQSYAEFVSYGTLLGLPLLHYTAGVCPETGRRRVACGIVAIGRIAVGVVAVGQAACGVVAVGQAAIGLIFGLGQLATGLVALGQLAMGGFAAGQIAVGAVALGQIGIGAFAFGQLGYGLHVWDMRACDPAAKDFFSRLFML